ncbi:unnamed protein product [Darwinula stevensoni]|uniref:Uncharacterized protein n=1 Tax=Darwinula stevensoni TaxID=69355 RepID=A0A7R9A0V4_9CRUS|nr:unnamed protein product [Darwinula stevensoni]CAG0886389.1 unnamed protein product [Darwinula stevensoni]
MRLKLWHDKVKEWGCPHYDLCDETFVKHLFCCESYSKHQQCLCLPWKNKISRVIPLLCDEQKLTVAWKNDLKGKCDGDTGMEEDDMKILPVKDCKARVDEVHGRLGARTRLPERNRKPRDGHVVQGGAFTNVGQ